MYGLRMLGDMSYSNWMLYLKLQIYTLFRLPLSPFFLSLYQHKFKYIIADVYACVCVVRFRFIWKTFFFFVHFFFYNTAVAAVLLVSFINSFCVFSFCLRLTVKMESNWSWLRWWRWWFFFLICFFSAVFFRMFGKRESYYMVLVWPNYNNSIKKIHKFYIYAISIHK